MPIQPVHNTDPCGRCKKQHQRNRGNDHLCLVHGACSPGCCDPMCSPAEWVFVEGRGPVRKTEFDPAGLRLFRAANSPDALDWYEPTPDQLPAGPATAG